MIISLAINQGGNETSFLQRSSNSGENRQHSYHPIITGGKEPGQEERQENIAKFITIFRKRNISDEIIIEDLMEEFELTEEEARAALGKDFGERSSWVVVAMSSNRFPRGTVGGEVLSK